MPWLFVLLTLVCLLSAQRNGIGHVMIALNPLKNLGQFRNWYKSVPCPQEALCCGWVREFILRLTAVLASSFVCTLPVVCALIFPLCVKACQ